MSDRHKPHNGRGLSGDYRVRSVDVEELLTEPEGTEYLKDDVRLGGAVADTGLEASRRAERIHQLVEDNRSDVAKFNEPPAAQQREESRNGSRQG